MIQQFRLSIPKLLAVSAICLYASIVFGQKIQTEFDDTADYTKFKTFPWRMASSEATIPR